MKTNKLCFIFLFFSFLFALPAFARVNHDIPYLKAYLGDDRNQFDIYEIVEPIRNKINLNPKDYTNYEMLALVYDHFGMYDKAIEVLKLAIERYPSSGKGRHILYGNLARMYLALGQLEIAKPVIIKAIQHSPFNLTNHTHLLRYYILKGDYEQAALELKTINNIDKGKDWYEGVYIYIVNTIKNKDKILKFFEECIKANPQSQLPYRIMAITIRDFAKDDLDAKFPQVMDYFNKALELESEYLPTYVSIAETHLMRAISTENKAYFDDSLAWFNKAYKIDEKNLMLAYAMGNLFIYMKKYDKAIDKLEYAYENGLKHDLVVENLSLAYNNKAYFLYKAGDHLSEGLKLIDKAISLNPDDGIVLGTKAEILYALKRYEQAHDYINRAIELEPDNLEMQQDLENIVKALEENKKQAKNKKEDKKQSRKKINISF